MRVCMTTFGGDGGAGIGQYIHKLLRDFPKVAPDIQFDVLLYEDEKPLYIPDADNIRPICQDPRLRNPWVNLAWHQVGLPRLCRRERYDVVFIPSGNRRLPYSVPCPSVGTFHDLSSLHIRGKYDPVHAFYNLHVMPMLVRQLTWVITISESSKRDLVEYVRVPEERIIVISQGVELDRYYPRDKAAAQAHVAERYKIRAPYLMFISRIEHPGKNHVKLIHAFDQLKAKDGIPHQLVLVGGDWTRSDVVHQAAEASRFRHDIVFTGFAANEDMPDLYCGCDVFVFPSLFEGFGLPVLQAMSCGVPVACANISSIPEVAGDAGVLFNPHDEHSIEQAIRDAVADAALRAQCIRRGLDRAKEFTSEKTATRTIEVLRRSVKERL